MYREHPQSSSEGNIASFVQLYSRLINGIKAAPARLSDRVKVRYDQTYRSCDYMFEWMVDSVPRAQIWESGNRSYKLFLSMNDIQERLGFVEVATFQRGTAVPHTLEVKKEMILIVTDATVGYETNQFVRSTMGPLVSEHRSKIIPPSSDVNFTNIQLRKIALETIGIFQSMPRKPLPKSKM